jgi:hypothetical protein
MSDAGARDRKKFSVRLSIRVPARLDAALRRQADREENAPSAVARRLLAEGLHTENADNRSGTSVLPSSLREMDGEDDPEPARG